MRTKSLFTVIPYRLFSSSSSTTSSIPSFLPFQFLPLKQNPIDSPSLAPLVVLLGWWRAPPSVFYKYVQFYHTQCESHVLYTTLPWLGVFQPKSVAREMQQMKTLFSTPSLLHSTTTITDTATTTTNTKHNHRPLDVNSTLFNEKKNPMPPSPLQLPTWWPIPSHCTFSKIVVHCFSVNGAFTFTQLLPWFPYPIHQCIYDSGPMVLTSSNLSHGLSVSFTPRSPLCSSLIQPGLKLYFQSTSTLHQLNQHWSSLPHIPSLILGGQKDTIVTPTELIQFKETYLTNKNQSTELVWFETSGHVEHLKKEPEKYKQVIQSFLSIYK